MYQYLSRPTQNIRRQRTTRVFLAGRRDAEVQKPNDQSECGRTTEQTCVFLSLTESDTNCYRRKNPLIQQSSA